METSETISSTYDWALNRISKLCKKKLGQYNHKSVHDADAIHQEFDEWIKKGSLDEETDFDVLLLEYIGEGSHYD